MAPTSARSPRRPHTLRRPRSPEPVHVSNLLCDHAHKTLRRLKDGKPHRLPSCTVSNLLCDHAHKNPAPAQGRPASSPALTHGRTDFHKTSSPRRRPAPPPSAPTLRRASASTPGFGTATNLPALARCGCYIPIRVRCPPRRAAPHSTAQHISRVWLACIVCARRSHVAPSASRVQADDEVAGHAG